MIFIFHSHSQLRCWQRRLLGWGLWSLSTFAAALNLEITVDGIDGQPLANVLAQLAIYQERADPDLTPERLEYLHHLAAEQIRSALIPFGFYQTAIDAPAQPERSGDRWQVYYHITPGVPVTVGTVDYQISGEGATNPAFPVT
ncbi:POTRA domain-containing protein, partial [Chromatium okenii]|uniref:POTRA domain-containing protein n=1 Tax=Chromatium okenii TaxID=61644 RepID=UPI0026EBD43C